jgi:hypothetical protein
MYRTVEVGVRMIGRGGIEMTRAAGGLTKTIL